MLLRNKIITVCVILWGIYMLLDLWNYLNFSNFLDNKNIVENKDISKIETVSKKNIENESTDIEENKSKTQKNLVTDLELIKKGEPVKIRIVELGIIDNDGNGWYTSTVLPKLYWFKVKNEWLEFYFEKPITIYSDKYIWFWPMWVLPESPTDRLRKSHYYNLSIIKKNNAQKKWKILMWSTEIYYSSEWGMCELRKYVLLWIYNDIKISSSGCHTTKEEDDKYIENVFNNLIKIDIDYDISELELEELTHENFWNNLDFFAHWDYNFSNIKFLVPTIWNKNVAQDTDSFSRHSFTDWKNYINIKDIYIGGCEVIFSYCETSFNRTTMEKFELYKKYKESKWMIYEKYYFQWLQKHWYVTPDGLDYLFTVDGWILEFNFKFKDNILNTEFRDLILNSIKFDAKNLIEDEKIQIIYDYYNNINQKNFKTAYDMKNNAWYNLEKFIEIYQTVTDVLVEFKYKEKNNYHLTIKLVDNWITEEYSVILNLNNDKITTVKTIKIN